MILVPVIAYMQLEYLPSTDDINVANQRAIDLVGGPVILVGYSYGGFVITNAAYNNPKVKGLVYIAAFAPNEGQSLGNFVDFAKFPKGFWCLIVEDLSISILTFSTRQLLKILIQLKIKSWLLNKTHLINLSLLKNLDHRPGSSFRHGIKSLRTTMPFLLMLNECLQNKSMLLLSHLPLAMYHLCHIQMKLHSLF